MKKPNHFEDFKEILDTFVKLHAVEPASTARHVRKLIADEANALRLEGFPGDKTPDGCVVITLVVSTATGIYRIPLKFKATTDLARFIRQIKEVMTDYRFQAMGTVTRWVAFETLLELSPWFSVNPLDLTYSAEGVCLGGHIVQTTLTTRRLIRVTLLNNVNEMEMGVEK